MDNSKNLALLLEAAPVAIVTVDHTGTILYTNTRLNEMFGYERGALLGQPVEAVMPPRPMVIRSDAFAAEAVHLLEDRPFQILVLPVVDADGKAVGLIRLHDLVKAGLV